MLDLPIIGEDIPTLYDEGFEELGCPVSKENSSYSRYMEVYQHIQGAISKIEQNAFIFF